jgi:hypothetical protein
VQVVDPATLATSSVTPTQTLNYDRRGNVIETVDAPERGRSTGTTTPTANVREDYILSGSPVTLTVPWSGTRRLARTSRSG